MEGFTKGMIESYFHFSKLIIGRGESTSRETRQAGINQFPKETMGRDLRQVGGNGKEERDGIFSPVFS